MTEHVHEWWARRHEHDIAEWFEYCCVCGETIEGESVTARLNVTERLSAEFRTWAENIDPKHSPQIEREQFTEWADILEGK